jgi:hypothetical protein
MYRNDTWDWLSDFTYKTGSVVTYLGDLYVSRIDDNLNITPWDHPEAWELLSGIEHVIIGSVMGTRVNTTVIFTESQMYEALELDFTGDSIVHHDGMPWSEIVPDSANNDSGGA